MRFLPGDWRIASVETHRKYSSSISMVSGLGATPCLASLQLFDVCAIRAQVLLVVKRTWGFSVCLGLVTDILNNYAVAALIHAGESMRHLLWSITALCSPHAHASHPHPRLPSTLRDLLFLSPSHMHTYRSRHRHIPLAPHPHPQARPTSPRSSTPRALTSSASCWDWPTSPTSTSSWRPCGSDPPSSPSPRAPPRGPPPPSSSPVRQRSTSGDGVPSAFTMSPCHSLCHAAHCSRMAHAARTWQPRESVPSPLC